MTIEELLSKTIKVNNCLIWQGTKRNTGYGCIKYEGKLIDTHRLSWILDRHMAIPEGLYILHKCDNRLCINPKHLILGNQSENMKDAYDKGRLHMPEGIRFTKGHVALNSKISLDKAKEIKDRIKNKDYTTLKQLSIEFNVPYQLIRDIKGNRSYINI